MKMILIIFLVLGSFASFAQGILFTLPKAPTILQIEVMVPFSGKPIIRHVEDEPWVIVSISFDDKLKDFSSKIRHSSFRRLSCTGDFEMGKDNKIVQVKSLKLCVDQDGVYFADSVGMEKISQEEREDEYSLIEPTLDLNAEDEGHIYWSHLPKESSLESQGQAKKHTEASNQ